MISRIYIDTSVIGGCFDEEFSFWSSKFMEEVRKGKKIAVISDLTLKELEYAPARVQKVVLNLPGDYLEVAHLTEEAGNLVLRQLNSYRFEEVDSAFPLGGQAPLRRLAFGEAEHPPDEGEKFSPTPPPSALSFKNLFDSALAESYIQNKVVDKKHVVDAQHIAIATIERVDVLVSWNFQQIVNLNRIPYV